MTARGEALHVQLNPQQKLKILLLTLDHISSSKDHTLSDCSWVMAMISNHNTGFADFIIFDMEMLLIAKNIHETCWESDVLLHDLFMQNHIIDTNFFFIITFTN